MSGTARSLADLDAALDRLERDGTRFWTALDGSEALPSKAKPLTEQGFGRFGQFGRLADEDEARNVANSDVARPAAARHADESERRIKSYSNTVQTVQTVQSDEKCPPEQAVSFGQSDPLAVQNRGSAVQSADRSTASWTCEGEDAATCRPPKPCRGTEPSSAARRHDALNRWLAANPSPRASAAGVGVISTGSSRNGSMHAPPEMPPNCRRARAHRAELIENLRNEADHCSRCGAPTQPLEIGGADRSGWICNACLNAAGLLMLCRARSEAATCLATGAHCDKDPPPHFRAYPWHDDRAWIADIVRATTPADKLAVLAEWVAAAGGRLGGRLVLLPPLPQRLATLELRRMVRQARLVIGDANAGAAEVARLLEAGRRAVKSPDALADPAEVMLRGELT